MHILSVKHVINIAPFLLIVVEVVLVENGARLPITHDKLHLRCKVNDMEDGTR